jgi:hypothetical protein
MTHRLILRHVLPLVAFVLEAITACGAPPAGESISATPPAFAALPASSPVAATNTTIAFPQQAPTLAEQAYPAALHEGTLMLEDDCLRVQPSYDANTSYVPFLPPDVTLCTPT